MSEETKLPDQEPQEAPQEEPKAEETAEQAAPQEPEKAPKGKKKKEKGYTFTREQVEQMELAVKQLDSVKDQFVRLTAEYDNYRKRTAKEKESIYSDAKLDTVKPFLDVADNLDRAVSQFEEGDPHRQGVEMICKQFAAVLEKLGVTEIEALGQPFDPEKHNAVMHIDDDNYGENVVAQVFQAGFMLGDRVLRHAIVQVAN